MLLPTSQSKNQSLSQTKLYFQCQNKIHSKSYSQLLNDSNLTRSMKDINRQIQQYKLQNIQLDNQSQKLIQSIHQLKQLYQENIDNDDKKYYFKVKISNFYHQLQGIRHDKLKYTQQLAARQYLVDNWLISNAGNDQQPIPIPQVSERMKFYQNYVKMNQTNNNLFQQPNNFSVYPKLLALKNSEPLKNEVLQMSQNKQFIVNLDQHNISDKSNHKFEELYVSQDENQQFDDWLRQGTKDVPQQVGSAKYCTFDTLEHKQIEIQPSIKQSICHNDTMNLATIDVQTTKIEQLKEQLKIESQQFQEKIQELETKNIRLQADNQEMFRKYRKQLSENVGFQQQIRNFTVQNKQIQDQFSVLAQNLIWAKIQIQEVNRIKISLHAFVPVLYQCRSQNAELLNQINGLKLQKTAIENQLKINNEVVRTLKGDKETLSENVYLGFDLIRKTDGETGKLLVIQNQLKQLIIQYQTDMQNYKQFTMEKQDIIRQLSDYKQCVSSNTDQICLLQQQNEQLQNEVSIKDKELCEMQSINQALCKRNQLLEQQLAIKEETSLQDNKMIKMLMSSFNSQVESSSTKQALLSVNKQIKEIKLQLFQLKMLLCDSKLECDIINQQLIH